MGFLRKVGRKISKKLGKVFGSKLGAVVGAVGLYMLMGPVAKGLTGWAKSAFGIGKGAGDVAAISEAAAATTQAAETAQIAAGTDAVSAELAKTIGSTGSTASATAAGASSGAQALAAAGQQTVGAEALLTEQSLLAGESLATQAVSKSAALTTESQIANMTNNMDIANSAIAAIDSAAITGSTNVYPTITDSLINEAVPALDQPLSVVKNNLADQTKLAFDSSKYTNLEAGKISPEMLTDSFNAPVSGQATSGPTVDFNAIADDIANKKDFGIQDINLQDFVPTEQVPVTQSIKYPDALTDAETLKYADSLPRENLFAKGVDKVKGYFGDDFVGDTVQGVTTGLIMGELQGDYEEPFRSAGVASQPLSEAAQGNYIQAVAPSAMAATGMTRMPSFQELSQQTLYGTGSPNYLSQFYQPLATPQAIG